MELYKIILYIIFGVLPSFVWLLYYLNKDLHPEPKKIILKIFLYGAIITIPVFFIQIWLSSVLENLQPPLFPVFTDIIKWFFIIALTEEVFKYLAVRLTVFKSKELDEPLDIMLYMIIVALGFAAVENILYLFSPIKSISFVSLIETTALIAFIRFIGATFLHTLSSALLGYFLAMSFFETKKRLSLTIIGISLAVFLHGLYDFSIMILPSPFNFTIPIIIIVGLAIFIFLAFNKVKGMKSVSKI